MDHVDYAMEQYGSLALLEHDGELGENISPADYDLIARRIRQFSAAGKIRRSKSRDRESLAQAIYARISAKYLYDKSVKKDDYPESVSTDPKHGENFLAMVRASFEVADYFLAGSILHNYGITRGTDALDPKEGRFGILKERSGGGIRYRAFVVSEIIGNEVCFDFLDESGNPLGKGAKSFSQNDIAEMEVAFFDDGEEFRLRLEAIGRCGNFLET